MEVMAYDLKVGQFFQFKNSENVYMVEEYYNHRPVCTLVCRHSEDAEYLIRLYRNIEVNKITLVEYHTHSSHPSWVDVEKENQEHERSNQITAFVVYPGLLTSCCSWAH